MDEAPEHQKRLTPYPDTSPYGCKHHPVEFLQSNDARLNARQSEDDMIHSGKHAEVSVMMWLFS